MDPLEDMLVGDLDIPPLEEACAKKGTASMPLEQLLLLLQDFHKMNELKRKIAKAKGTLKCKHQLNIIQQKIKDSNKSSNKDKR